MVVSALVLAGDARLEGGRPQVGDPGADAAAMAAVVARDVPDDAAVAVETRRVGDLNRGGSARPCAAPHSRPHRSLAAVTHCDLALAVDRLLRARRWPGAMRREWFFSRPVGAF